MADKKKARKRSPAWETKDEFEFDGDIVITDTCYIGGFEEVKIAFEGKGLESSTYYGDWGCTVYGNPVGKPGSFRAGEPIGEFCADGGRVCVYHLDEVLEKFPGFKKWMDEHPWCVAVIKGFKGVVKLIAKTTKWKSNIKDENGKRFVVTDVELHIRGEGEKDGKPFTFETCQTSL